MTFELLLYGRTLRPLPSSVVVSSGEEAEKQDRLGFVLLQRHIVFILILQQGTFWHPKIKVQWAFERLQSLIWESLLRRRIFCSFFCNTKTITVKWAFEESALRFPFKAASVFRAPYKYQFHQQYALFIALEVCALYAVTGDFTQQMLN